MDLFEWILKLFKVRLMMKKQDILAIGLMTFAMFLGAGNIIFPPSLGIAAGDNLFTALGGFLITSIGLPVITLLTFGYISSIDKLTSALPKWLDKGFWIVLLVCIAPAFAGPRAITVAYEMGLSPLVESDQLLVFSLIFSLVVLALSIRENRLVDSLGKIVTPALILMLLAIIVVGFINPVSPIGEPNTAYTIAPFTNGLLQGYLTMDSLGAIGFGFVIINAIKSNGVDNPKSITKMVFIIAGIYAVLMTACYVSIAYIGATSSAVANGATNGGEILISYVVYQFGMLGQLLFSAIIIVACLTTVVGLSSAFGGYFHDKLGFPYKPTVVAVVALTGLVSNFGLDQIITFSLPAILILCPVAMSLVISVLVFGSEKTAGKQIITAMITATTFATFDSLNMVGLTSEGLNSILSQFVPLYDDHASWVIPFVVVIVIMKAIILNPGEIKLYSYWGLSSPEIKKSTKTISK
ncbi:branched-chain amino acid transport system II carrier protein [Shewanella sp. KX20019]|uniref:branched-chain amino acid transport system II carrier protein n=1 Tax=Shewanella sp. KX20019 TaxID=2803864 RepID=UPI001927471A|nr:branched-chain amino acid transport system II carrier protein [Shewanella sp. KX20019]QQX80821.1 branched-chain amino acid transport system II carrier protein [Shewanella sp. KX20019]